MRLGELAALILPALIAIYTLNYGRWAWRRQIRRGAIGLTFLAVSAVALPAYVIWLNR